jgi:leucyl aminopeptidase
MASTKQREIKPIYCVSPNGVNETDLTVQQKAWAQANAFDGQIGKLLALPHADGSHAGFLFGLGDKNQRPALATGHASLNLAPGRYALKGDYGNPTFAALGFELGAYRYNKYKTASDAIELETIEGADLAELNRLRDAAFIARDLINTPSNDLGPDVFEAAVRVFAKQRKMEVTSIVGDDLISENFPMIHAVGRASAQAPRLLDLRWGSKSAPKLTLVGKGVTFDTGGLNIKPGASMALMKKDMGGAANILGLAHAIVDAKLNVRLRVLLPIVENSIAGNAFRPGDVLASRNGMSVEIGNTDAEGRLILADALTLADEETPELIIDMATLTGAARVALGPELPALFSTNDEIAQSVQAFGMQSGDPVWQMPLWAPYAQNMASKIADINHITLDGFAGSVTAALFLQKFVKKANTWMHLDIFGWAPTPRAGQPYGGADQGVRATYSYLKHRFR